ncbi:GntR family transcriptional regulator [Ottowia thiooxydans]|uniref:DNA-binding GntR family transcriptional regulator n=1 Tax=Ottowia thiooxydans TaxID=219182 RepID=A0ABV2Q7Q1_9BURK
MQSIKKQPAGTQATDALRAEIIKGRILPGTRLTEVVLADQFEVSRGTVRVALQQLSQEGLIIQVPYTGWIVIPISSQDAWELYTLRAALEALAAKLATEQMTESGRVALRKCLDGLAEACEQKNSRAVAEADFRLHKTIISLAKHERLANQYRLVEQQVRIYIASNDALTVNYQNTINFHSQIVEAILAGNAAEASRLSEEHNTHDGERFVQHLRKIEQMTNHTKIRAL